MATKPKFCLSGRSPPVATRETCPTSTFVKIVCASGSLNFHPDARALALADRRTAADMTHPQVAHSKSVHNMLPIAVLAYFRFGYFEFPQSVCHIAPPCRRGRHMVRGVIPSGYLHAGRSSIRAETYGRISAAVLAGTVTEADAPDRFLSRFGSENEFLEHDDREKVYRDTNRRNVQLRNCTPFTHLVYHMDLPETCTVEEQNRKTQNTDQ